MTSPNAQRNFSRMNLLASPSKQLPLTLMILLLSACVPDFLSSSPSAEPPTLTTPAGTRVSRTPAAQQGDRGHEEPTVSIACISDADQIPEWADPNQDLLTNVSLYFKGSLPTADLEGSLESCLLYTSPSPRD